MSRIIRTSDMAFLEMEDKKFVLLGPPMGTMKGTAKNFTVMGMPACIEKDGTQITPFLAGVTFPYLHLPDYVIPGLGSFSFTVVKDTTSSKASVTNDGSGLLVQKTKIDVKFNAQVRAMKPPKGPAPPEPDATGDFKGKVNFMTTNFTVASTP